MIDTVFIINQVKDTIDISAVADSVWTYPISSQIWGRDTMHYSGSAIDSVTISMSTASVVPFTEWDLALGLFQQNMGLTSLIAITMVIVLLFLFTERDENYSEQLVAHHKTRINR